MKPASVSKPLLAVFLFLVLANLVIFYLYFHPQAFRALLAKFSKTPQPGSCLILEEKYCQSGQLIENPSLPGSLLAAFRVPKNTVLFAPVDGFYSQTPTFFFIKDETTKEVVKYPGATITVADDNTAAAVKAIYSFIYFKEKENFYSTIQKGDIIGWISEQPIDFLGDYNLVVGVDRQNFVEGKVVFEGANEELKKMLKIR